MTVAVMRVCAAMIVLFLPGWAQAQISAGAAVVSDYRFRGVSLSDGQAVPQATLAYDDAQGWYAGAFASRVAMQSHRSNTQLSVYGGYARRIDADLSWEAGIADARFGQGAPDYLEAYVGLASDQYSARLYYAPNYFGQGQRTLYAEFNGSRTLGAGVQLVGHAGLLRATAGGWPGAIPASRADLRIGVSVDVLDWKVQLAWVAAQKNSYIYRNYTPPAARTWVLGFSYAL